MAEKLCRDARAWCILLVLTCSSMGGVSLAFSVTSPMRGAGILIIPGLGAFRRAPPLNSRGGGVVFSRPEIRGGGRSSRHVAVLAGAQLDDLSVLAAQSSPPKEADEAFEKSVELYKKLQKEGGASAVGAVAMMLEAMRSLDKALDLDWQWVSRPCMAAPSVHPLRIKFSRTPFPASPSCPIVRCEVELSTPGGKGCDKCHVHAAQGPRQKDRCTADGPRAPCAGPRGGARVRRRFARLSSLALLALPFSRRLTLRAQGIAARGAARACPSRSWRLPPSARHL